MTDAQALRHQLRAAGYCPIPLYGKEPPVYNAKKKNNSHRGLADWEQLTAVTPEQIDMWSKIWPDSINTGVLTFNMPVLDIDILNEEAACAIEAHVRERFEERGYVLVRIGKPPKRAIPFRVAMDPFKKFNVSLTAPNGSEGEKIEFLANGAQLVVSGIHPETGKPYSWFGGEPGQIRLEELPDIREDEAHTLIEEIIEILIRDFGYKRAPERPRKSNGAKPHDGGGGGDRDWQTLYENIRTGRDLHNSVRDLASKLIACGTNSGAVVNQLRALMEISAAPKNERWHERVTGIPAAVDSAVAKYGREPGARSSVEPEAAPPPEPKAEPEPAPEPEAESEQPAPPAPRAAKPRHPRFPLATLETITMSIAPNYLVKGILPRVGLGVVWGPPKCGKSFWTFDLVMHIATGRHYRGRPVRKGAVVYLALEGAFGFAGRVEAWRQHHNPPKGTPFYLLAVSVNLIADQKVLIDAIREQVEGGPTIVVVDTLNRALLGDENDSKDMAKFIRAADTIRTTFDCLVLLIHHCGIVGTRPRGHTSLAGADDVQIQIAKDKEGLVVATIEHMKDGPSGAVLANKLESISLGTDIDGDPITSCIITPTSTEAVPPKLPKGADLALEVLRKLLASSIDSIRAPEAANLPADIRLVRQATWREYFYKATPQDNQTAKQKAFVRAHETLLKNKLIDVWDEYIWLSPDKS
jgi:AAA domain/Bifunctional DNA primase/polymerase, N-terminal